MATIVKVQHLSKTPLFDKNGIILGYIYKPCHFYKTLADLIYFHQQLKEDKAAHSASF